MSHRNKNHEKYFNFSHLVEGDKSSVALRFSVIIFELNEFIKEGPEKSAGVRKMLEAQDCFIRACEDL